MSEKFYFGKFDKWLSEKIEEASWSGIIVSTVFSIFLYLFFYWMPEIVLFFGGGFTSSLEYKSRMIVAKGFFLLILLFNIITAIKLIRKK